MQWDERQVWLLTEPFIWRKQRRPDLRMGKFSPGLFVDWSFLLCPMFHIPWLLIYFGEFFALNLELAHSLFMGLSTPPTPLYATNAPWRKGINGEYQYAAQVLLQKHNWVIWNSEFRKENQARYSLEDLPITTQLKHWTSAMERCILNKRALESGLDNLIYG